VGGFFRARPSTTVSSSLSLEANPALIALFIELELLTTVADGHRVFLLGLGNHLYQGFLGTFINVFALKVSL
jgi:hypothetical protein